MLYFPRETVDMCQKAEKAGVSWITVHGRTKEQRGQPVNFEAIKTIKDSLQCPVIANGDINSLEDVQRIAELTGVNGNHIREKNGFFVIVLKLSLGFIHS